MPLPLGRREGQNTEISNACALINIHIEKLKTKGPTPLLLAKKRLGM
jgi:hypothetical protein